MFDPDSGVCEGIEALVAMLRLPVGHGARRGFFVLVIFGLLAGPNASDVDAGEDRVKAAVFDFELIDTSLEGEMKGKNAAEQRRLVLISEFLRRKLRLSGAYMVLDMSPAAKAVTEAGHLYGCNGCEAVIARTLGAEVAITGTVQKVSNLILNINIYMRDVTTGKRVRSMSVDIRGNTDESWSRGVSYLVRNRLLKD